MEDIDFARNISRIINLSVFNADWIAFIVHKRTRDHSKRTIAKDVYIIFPFGYDGNYACSRMVIAAKLPRQTAKWKSQKL